MNRTRRFAPLFWCRATFRQLVKMCRSRRFDPVAEAAFQSFYATQNYTPARFGVAIGFIAWCLFGVWDVLAFPELCGPLLTVRLLLVAPILGGLWWVIVHRPEVFKASMQRCLLVGQASILFGLFLLMGIVWTANPLVALQRFWPAFMGVLFYQFAFLGMRLYLAAILGTLTLVALSVAVFLSGMATPIAGALVLQFILLNALGMIVCARHEIHHRTLFRLREHYLRQVRTAQTARAKALRFSQRVNTARGLLKAERAKTAAAIAEKERFFSAAYHDLQQPLSVIGLYLRLARGKLGHASSSDIQPDLAVIEGAVQDIALMFKGVRDTWDIGGLEPTIEAVELNPVFDEIAREWDDRARKKGLEFRVIRRMRPPFLVLSDRTLLKRALSNLIGNAIKYTEHGGVVLGSVGRAGRSSVLIHVRDTGIGIPEAFQTRIFDEYFRIDPSRHDRKRGLGLGLSIVRRIEQSLPGHRLSFHSRPGHGSRFSLEVPAAEEPVAASPSPDVPSAEESAQDILAGKYVVVVEDDRLILDGLVEAIREAGCLVEGAESAAAARALFAARDRCPDILVTDYRLQCGETALDIIASLRTQFEWSSDTPALIVTGELMDLTPLLTGLQGPYDIYRKPIDTGNLLRRLRELITPPGPSRTS